MDFGHTIAKKWKPLLKIFFSLFLLLFLIQKVRIRAIGQILSSAQLNYFVLAMILYLICQPLRTLRWGILLKKKQIHIPQGRLLAIYFIGMFFNTFLPTIMGGDAVRSYYILKKTDSFEISLASVIMERFCGLFTLLFVGFLSSLYLFIRFKPSPLVNFSLWVSLSILLVMILAFFPPIFKIISWPLKIFDRWKILARTQEVYQAVRSYRSHSLALFWSFLLSTGFVFAVILTCYCLSLSLAWKISFYPFLYTVPLITIISMLPVSFGGLGVREGTCVLLFTQIGIPAASAFSLALLWYFINIVAGVIGGLLYPFYRVSPTSSEKISKEG